MDLLQLTSLQNGLADELNEQSLLWRRGGMQATNKDKAAMAITFLQREGVLPSWEKVVREVGMDKKSRALEVAAKQFRMYEEQHRAKGTPEGDLKARTNFAMAEMCENALREDPPVKPKPVLPEGGPIITEVIRQQGGGDMVTAIWTDGERTTMSLRNYPGEDMDTIRGRLEQKRFEGG